MILAKLKCPYTRDSLKPLWTDGRLAARFGHDRRECPYRGDINNQSGQREYRRTERGAKIASERRRAWLRGFDDETAAMKKEAELAALPPHLLRTNDDD